MFTACRPFPGVTHITDIMGVSFTLIEGEDSALLLDAGYGLEDVAAYIGTLTGKPVELILSHGLALWDSIASCVITGSSDASIRDVCPNDLRIILDHAPIERIYCNGRKSHEMYEKYILPVLGREAGCLPSTSPANAAWSLEKLISAWSVILPDQK